MSTLINLDESKHATSAHAHNTHARQDSATSAWHMLPSSINSQQCNKNGMQNVSSQNVIDSFGANFKSWERLTFY